MEKYIEKLNTPVFMRFYTKDSAISELIYLMESLDHIGEELAEYYEKKILAEYEFVNNSSCKIFEKSSNVGIPEFRQCTEAYLKTLIA